MDFWAFLDEELFAIGKNTVTVGRLAAVATGVVMLYVIGYTLRRSWIERFFLFEETTESDKRKMRRVTAICLILGAALIVVLGLPADYSLRGAVEAIEGDRLNKLRLSTLLQAFLIYYLARLVDVLLSNVLTHRYQQRREQELQEGAIYQVKTQQRSQARVGRIVQPIVYLLALAFIIQQTGFDDSFRVPWSDSKITLRNILTGILILLFTRLVLWILTEIILYPYYKQKDINVGSQFAINRLLTYFVLMIAMIGTLQYIGLDLTVLLGGAAALLVGIGLGLQQTFNDLICGIILLFERTVEVGDIVDMAGLVGTVKRIGIRTSLVETRDQVSVIVPNSKLVADNVINWSHFDSKARFRVGVGVAYGSDTALVKEILENAAEEHNRIARRPKPFARFVNFGDSSLDFEIIFWSRDLIRIEDVKSDLRFAIDAAFRESKVSIPFPQRDIWVRETPMTQQKAEVGNRKSEIGSQKPDTEEE